MDGDGPDEAMFDASDAADRQLPDAGPDAECENACDTPGLLRCVDTTGSFELCIGSPACRQWQPAGECQAGQICCNGACVASDISNCHACGTQCTGSTPACSDALKRCVCAADSCQVGLFCDSKTGSCGAANYYVDASAAAGGDGTQGRPFKTITAALQRVSADHAVAPQAARSILVAEGDYDAELGEKFPLEIRGPTSLIGAGRNKTRIIGLANVDHSQAGGPQPEKYDITVLTGDNAAVVRISRLAIDGGPGPGRFSFAVFCDRGGAAQSTTSEVGLTILEDVEILSNYHAGVNVNASTIPVATGCHLRMLSSKISGSHYAVAAVGCGETDTARVPVALELGDDSPAHGNLLSATGGYSTVVLMAGCVRRGVLQYNTFTDGYTGVAIDQRSDPARSSNSFRLKHNVFRRLSATGLLIRTGIVEELSGSTFSGISSALVPLATWDAVALNVQSSVDGEAIPRIVKARGNQFLGNDIAMQLGGATTSFDATAAPSDFGTAADPGNNVFRCNSSRTGKGADILVHLSGGPMIPFAGNAWDHSPPEVQVGPAPRNGTDIARFYETSPTLDITNATVSAIECPAGQTP
jgi:hypothetical protein